MERSEQSNNQEVRIRKPLFCPFNDANNSDVRFPMRIHLIVAHDRSKARLRSERDLVTCYFTRCVSFGGAP